MSELIISPMQPDEWSQVGALIHQSTNSWYQSHLGHEIFNCSPSETDIFCKVYEALDPGCCLIARLDGNIAGSCFYHPRPTHISLGILNVASDYFGRGIARALLNAVCEIADAENKTVRLISSALNLDSFSLYSRAGFCPKAVYQDMIIPYPEHGHIYKSPPTFTVRDAAIEDLEGMVELELKHTGLSRKKDFKYFLENSEGIWHTSIAVMESGELSGFMVSHVHPASAIVGPGFATSEEVAEALVCEELNFRGPSTPLIVVPAIASNLIKSLYARGARNLELHLGQARGVFQEPTGYQFPTFLPETA